MFFSQLRLNSPIYILHKESIPYVEVGLVTNVTAPTPQISSMVGLGQPVTYSVDVSVNVANQTIIYQKMPANCEVADFAGNGNVFLSCTKEGVNNEVQTMRKRSADIIASVNYHQEMINVCDKIIEQLNPEVMEKAQQQQEIASLKEQLNGLMGLIKELRADKASAEKVDKKEKKNGNDYTD